MESIRNKSSLLSLFSFFFFFLSLLYHIGLAVDCYVSTTGNPAEVTCTNVNNPCPDFAAAFASLAGCTDVFAFGGTYNGANNRGFSLVDALPLTIQRFNGTVIIDLEDTNRFLEITQNSTAPTALTFSIQGIEIRNGLLTGDDGGGALHLQLTETTGFGNAVPLFIEDMIFRNNRFTGGDPSGGAVFSQNFPLTIRNSTFINNFIECSALGGPDCFGGALSSQREADNSLLDMIVEDCYFEGNYLENAHTGGIVQTSGGAFYLGPPAQTTIIQLNMRRTRFFNNRAVATGAQQLFAQGGAMGLDSVNATIECEENEMDLCVFANNLVLSEATTGTQQRMAGGAIAMPLLRASDVGRIVVNLRHVTLYNNTALCPTGGSVCGGTQYGGGAVASTRTAISGCRFCNNSSPGGNGNDIKLLSSANQDPEFNATLPPTVFTCNTTGPVISPLSFECSGPECLYPSAVVDPDTGICEACLAPFATMV